MSLPVLTTSAIIGFVTSEKGKALIGVLTELMGNGGNFKELVGKQAGAFAAITASNMAIDYKILPQDKYDALVNDPIMTPELRSKFDLALQKPEEQELFNAMLIAWLLMLRDRWDKA